MLQLTPPPARNRAMSSNPSAPHIWNLVPTGGLDQVSLGSSEDLKYLSQLDPKLWVALSCPVKGLEIA